MNATTDPSLDVFRLENPRKGQGKTTYRCPACALQGSDKTGNHLVIFADGKFTCAANPGDTEHRREIFALVGIKSDRKPDPEADRRWKEQRAKERSKERERDRLRETITRNRAALVERWRWDEADVWDDSPIRLEGPEVDDPRLFLARRFATDDVIWTGEKWQSGEKCGPGRWRTVEQWQDAAREDVGPLVTAGTWKPDVVTRSGANVAAATHLILDFDGPKGWRPADEADLERHLAESRAIVRWLREGLGWSLAAINWTGSKSLHAWFRDPGQECVVSLREAAATLGIDAGLIGHPEHPARVPGWVHERTGKRGQVLWMDL
jgi:hypothetical protein